MTTAVQESHNELAAHLAWCALMALHLASRYEGVRGEAREHVFLINWLSTALKQKRFPKAVATDLKWLIDQGRRLQISAKLKSKLEYLWNSGSGKLSDQTDLYRLNIAMSTAQNAGWAYSLLDEGQWKSIASTRFNDDISYIRIRKSSLESAFASSEMQVSHIEAVITGNIPGLNALLHDCLWEFSAISNEIPGYTIGKTLKDNAGINSLVTTSLMQ